MTTGAYTGYMALEVNRGGLHAKRQERRRFSGQKQCFQNMEQVYLDLLDTHIAQWTGGSDHESAALPDFRQNPVSPLKEKAARWPVHRVEGADALCIPFIA